MTHLASKYGMPWMGSKNSIAGWVVSNIPRADVFVDLFAGGCAVTHAAIESGRFNRFVCNDIKGTPHTFKDCIDGAFSGYCTVPTREQFEMERDDDIALAIMGSFANNCEGYLWSRDIEEIKVAASMMLSMPSLYERRMQYKKFVKLLAEFGLKEADGHNGDLQSLESLERLQSLERLIASQLDYIDVEIPDNSSIYCDPPYRNTNCGCYSGFDHERFDTWLSITTHMVIVSEYTCPSGCVEIASTEKMVTSAASTNSKAIERLFVQERFYDKYMTTMENEIGHQGCLF